MRNKVTPLHSGVCGHPHLSWNKNDIVPRSFIFSPDLLAVEKNFRRKVTILNDSITLLWEYFIIQGHVHIPGRHSHPNSYGSYRDSIYFTLPPTHLSRAQSNSKCSLTGSKYLTVVHMCSRNGKKGCQLDWKGIDLFKVRSTLKTAPYPTKLL